MLTRIDPTIDFRWYRGSPTSDLVARGELACRSRDRQRRFLGALDGPAAAARLGRLHPFGDRRRWVPADRGREAGDRRMDDEPARAREGRHGSSRGRQGLRRAARILRVDPRRRSAAGLAVARREATGRGSAGRRPGGRCRHLRRRSHRRRRRRGDAGLLSGIRRRRSHRYRVALLPGRAAAHAARHGKAGRARADDWLVVGHRVGEAEPARDRRRLVSRAAGRQRRSPTSCSATPTRRAACP